jgi:lipopolysaccharide/colanic/teichoic acid biosynthesis glycosyltransferase
MSDWVDRQRMVWRFRPSLYRSYLKRVVDLVVAISGLIPLSPLLLLIALAIPLSSPGPVFYRQQRVGKDGKPFAMLKFRTMRAGSSQDSHRLHVEKLIRHNLSPKDLGAESLKLPDDPRITTIGRWLRRLSLDELPQVFNVLRGEMSIVGPRPPLPYEYELYQPWHKQRLSVLPGITGLWQVTAHNLVSFDEMVELDLDYIEHMNLWLDLRIMAMTPLEMFTGAGKR